MPRVLEAFRVAGDRTRHPTPAEAKATLILRLGIAAVGHGASWLAVTSAWRYGGLPDHWYVQSSVMLIVLFVMATAMLFVRHVTTNFVLITARVVITALLGLPVVVRTNVQIPLVASLAVDIGATLPLLLALMASCVGWALIRLTHGAVTAWGNVVPASNDESVALLWFVAGLTLLVGLLVRWQEKSSIERINSLAAEAKTTAELSKVNLKLQEYTAEVERIGIMSERKRLSRELHDSVGYVLMNHITLMEVATRLAVRWDVTRLSDTEQAIIGELTDVLHQSLSQAKDGLAEVRSTLHSLRDDEKVSRITGISGVRKLIGAFRNTPVEVSLQLSNVRAHRFSDEVDYILYRSVQEGITNALRHGNATRIEILIWQGDQQIAVSIIDNGKGAKEVVKGIGLTGIGERIDRIGGELRAQSSPLGFELRVRIPWQTQQTAVE